MAYVNLYNEIMADKAQYFCTIRDFICKRNGTYADYSSSGIGWELWDSFYAVDEDHPQLYDWFVMKSTGENELETMYIYFRWQAASGTACWSYLFWDNVTHTGTTIKCGTASAIAITSTQTNFPINIYGDLSSVIVFAPINDTNAYMHVMAFGKSEKPWVGIGDEVVTSVSAVSAGSDVSITVDSVPATWEVGRELYLWTTSEVIATAKWEKTTIKTLAGNIITCDLNNNYTANFRLAEHNGYYCIYGNNFSSFINYITSDGSNGEILTNNKIDINFQTGGYEDMRTLEHVSMVTQKGLSGLMRNVFYTSNADITAGDTLIALDDVEYRYFFIYSNSYLAVKEV